MARHHTLAAAALAIGAALMLYGVAHDTRALEQRVQARDRIIERAESDIAVLAAERAFLARPERIEELARARGLGPITDRQYAGVAKRVDDGIADLLAGPSDAPRTP
jgi:cell division protein FtsL